VVDKEATSSELSGPNLTGAPTLQPQPLDLLSLHTWVLSYHSRPAEPTKKHSPTMETDHRIHQKETSGAEFTNSAHTARNREITTGKLHKQHTVGWEGESIEHAIC